MTSSVLVYLTIQDLETFWLAQRDSAWFQEHPILSRQETRLHVCQVWIVIKCFSFDFGIVSLAFFVIPSGLPATILHPTFGTW